MVLDPEADVGQAAVEAEGGEAGHDYLEYFDAEVGHHVARFVLEDAVDEHEDDEGGKGRDEEYHRFVFCG